MTNSHFTANVRVSKVTPDKVHAYGKVLAARDVEEITTITVRADSQSALATKLNGALDAALDYGDA